ARRLVREPHRAHVLGRWRGGRPGFWLDRARRHMTQAPTPPAGERALVVGVGSSSLAVAQFLVERGVLVRACDLRPAERLEAVLARFPAGTETLLGGYDERALDGCAAVYASPGVPWDSELLRTARERGLIVSSEIDLFFHLCPAPIVGIPGTNGKTTTSALVGQVLARGG